MTRALSINTRLVQASAALFGVTAIAGGAGLWAAFHLSGNLERAHETSSILRNHMDADMMHDALRGDVLAALLSADSRLGISLADVQTEMNEHAATFREMVAENEARAQSAELREVIAKVKPTLTEYIASAENLVNTAARDPEAARAMLPDFMTRFTALEEAMGAAGDSIEQLSARESASAQNDAGIAQALMIAAIIAAAVAIFGVSLAARRWMVRPLVQLADAMRRLSGGDLTANANFGDRRDEIGDMSQAFAEFRSNAEKKAALERVQQEAAEDAAKRSALLQQLTHQFSEQLSGALNVLNASSGTLGAEAGDLRAVTEASQADATLAARAADQITSTVQGISAATAQLSASIEDISRRIANSADVATKAVDTGRKADSVVSQLAEATYRITEIVTLIGDVANQTNLLALNATIEAARAGEAGRGFAVVANEVKGLATQTAKATEDIAEQITRMRTVSDGVVAEVRSVIAQIEEMREISAGIAAAATQQTQATNEIANNVRHATGNAASTADGVRALADATTRARDASRQVATQATTVQEQSVAMRSAAEAFFRSINAA